VRREPETRIVQDGNVEDHIKEKDVKAAKRAPSARAFDAIGLEIGAA
jgi:hypothetical protein